MYALCTKRQRSAPHDTSVVGQALKPVRAAVIAATIHYDSGRSVADSPFNLRSCDV